jgi:hypothetical protein
VGGVTPVITVEVVVAMLKSTWNAALLHDLEG